MPTRLPLSVLASQTRGYFKTAPAVTIALEWDGCEELVIEVPEDAQDLPTATPPSTDTAPA